MITKTTHFGLKERDIGTLVDIFRRFSSVKLVHIFGSRAKGTQKIGSEIDLAIMNDGVSDTTFRKIKSEMEDSSLPYYVGLVNFPVLKHPEFIDHIERVGKIFYEM